MTTPVPKFDHYKLETKFHDDYVVHTAYEWELSTRRKVLSTWKSERIIGAGAYGSVSLEKEKERGKLRAVKRLPRGSLPETGFSQELLALTKLKDASSPRAFANINSCRVIKIGTWSMLSYKFVWQRLRVFRFL